MRIDGSDVLNGGSEDDMLYGGGGRDSLNGGGGADRLLGGVGDDVLLAQAGHDTLQGGRGDDTLTGDSSAGGNYTLLGEEGDDTLVLWPARGKHRLDGGEGDDVALVYAHARTAGMRLDLSTGAGTLTDGTRSVVFNSIERLDIRGGAGDDSITGTACNDTVAGGHGNDTLRGGDDWLAGDGGRDVLTGGAGADSFVFRTAPAAGEWDSITDFDPAQDTIRLDTGAFGGLDAGVLADTAFAVSANGVAQAADDRILYARATGALYFDADGSGGGAAVQFAAVQAGLALTAADFVFF